MQHAMVEEVFVVLTLALAGGLSARLLRLSPLVGYIAAGVLGSLFLPLSPDNLSQLAEIGVILLLFSVGLELSLKSLVKTGRVALLGAISQMILIFSLSFIFLFTLGLSQNASIVLSAGFALSSTAVVVKILDNLGQTDTIHGQIMIGWLLVQDLAVIPIMAILPALQSPSEGFLAAAGQSFGSSVVIVVAVFFVGKMLAPYVIHTVASTNSRELLVLAAVSLALGTAFVSSIYGVSAALGAFLAGVVISETQENHAIFSETRPLREIFVVLFFVTLGLSINPNVLVTHFLTIFAITAFIIVSKVIIVFILTQVLGYKGKTSIAVALGLSQIGEFSFVILLLARQINLVGETEASIGIAATLITLVVTPFMFRSILPIWKKTKNISFLSKLTDLPTSEESEAKDSPYKNHIIICGFGRVGEWVGKALEVSSIPFVVIDYNQKVVERVRMKGVPVIYGDPAEPNVLKLAGVSSAKAIVIAIADRITSEEVISYIKSLDKKIKIIARAHDSDDWNALTKLKIKKVVQPEFEAALSIISEIFKGIGRKKSEVEKISKGLKISHALNN